MNSILAWFITFNFVNIAWVFFRAKDWDSAMKVLGSMFSFSNIVLPNPLAEKLAFLSNYGVEFGGIFVNIVANPKEIISSIFISFILVLFFKNSMEKIKDFKLNYKNTIIIIFSLVLSSFYMFKIFSSQNQVSEFLYFNF